ncbi:Panacea domain-containing protein [Nocardia vulneris]|uniref:Panacea domain-containing protein n=1 Tax=Nocardia vulneris TaxID=1141657 RepID=UPI0009E402FE|nr:type II toxin-antitoxin system antitoxin SocA domain-containing protein [Nocardia vulneris]
MLLADQVASVIIARHGGRWLDKMPLQKLLYYVQAWHLAITDRPLFPEKFHGWPMGPVIPELWRTRADVRTRQPENQKLDGIELCDLASNLVDLVLVQYGSMSGSELSALTHTETPWKESRTLLQALRRSRPIKNDSMARFYRQERLLGGRTAADLAAGGVHAPVIDTERVDIDTLLASLPEDKLDDDPWGGANLAIASPDDYDGIPLVRIRNREA